MLIKELERRFENELNMLYHNGEAVLLLKLALEKVLNLSYTEVKRIASDEEICGEDLLRIEKILTELRTGKPIQHILGEAHFYGSVFKVNNNVLIPRPETEELIDWIITDLREKTAKNLSVFDIGTGSGCIPISIKKHLPKFDVYGLDVSKDAILIAKENASLNTVQVSFIEADILNYTTKQKFDVMVSNPPYIRLLEQKEMHQNVLSFEPHLALFVNDERPLIFYEKIADFAKTNLTENGLLFFEINEYLGLETLEMLKKRGFKNVELRKDMQGKDRMIKALV